MLRLRNLARNPQLAFRVSPPLSQSVESANVRRVKFQRPWLRRFVTTAIIYGTAFHIWSSFVFVRYDSDSDTSEDPDGDKDELQQRAGRDYGSQRHDKDQLEMTDDRDITFVPLSLPLLRPGDFYAVSDPEWREFARISRDSEKLRKLKSDLVDMVMKDASKSTRLSNILGGQLSVTSYWLMHKFPYRAPPQYSRLGLEISDDSLSLVLRAMDPDEGNSLRRFMQPLYVALAIRDAFAITMKRQLSRLKGTTAEEDANPDNPFHPHVLPADLGKLESLTYLLDCEPQSSLSNNNGASNSSVQADGTHQSQDSWPRLHRSSLILSLRHLLLPGLGRGSDLHFALLAFWWRLNDCWARESPVPQRGSFHVSGPVGIKGRKGFCRIDVKGEYNPATDSWSKVSMQLRDLKLFKQAALGSQWPDA